MKATGITRRIDDLGRICIPKEVRRRIFGKENVSGHVMDFYVEGDNIILKPYVSTESIAANNSIDQFADRMINMLPGHKQDILHIAEQMKNQNT